MASKRVNVKAILADADLRRKLMVSTIQATQAREGIETSAEQAGRAYYVVTEAERAAFFDLVGFRPGGGREYDAREEQFVRLLNAAGAERTDVARRDFAEIDGAPLAYRNLDILGPIFRAHPRLGDTWADVEGGMNATESDRFLRYRWEPSPTSDRTWMTYSKGGVFSRFYSDIYRIIDWTNSGSAYKRVVADKYGSASRFVKSESFYGRPGLTWTEMTNKGFSVRRLPAGAIFNCKGPCAFPRENVSESYLLAIMNSSIAQALLSCLTGRSYGSSYVARLPVPVPSKEQAARLGELADRIYGQKAEWDRGNELSSSFSKPWLVEAAKDSSTLAEALQRCEDNERHGEAQVRLAYDQLDVLAFDLYGVLAAHRARILDSIGDRRRADRPVSTESLWLALEDTSPEQKRMEHVWRLLSFAVKLVVDGDDDGIVPFNRSTGETPLAERVRAELSALFPGRDESQLEVEIVNELRRSVKGYRKCASLDDWLANAYFEYHAGLYKSRPIYWHVASAQGTSPFAFGALVHYHRFDKNRMQKLRASYVRDTIEELRRDAGLADKAGRVDDRVELQAKLEEVQALDKKLQLLQEGHHEGAEGGDRDFRILTPWKEPAKRPKGWNPDLDDGVKVNIAPLDRAGILRVSGVAG